MKRWLLRFGGSLAIAGGLTQPSIRAGVSDADLVVRGQGVQITTKELNEAYDRFQTSMVNSGRLPAPQATEAFRSQVLERLLVLHLCESRANEDDRKRAKFESSALIEGLRNQVSSPEEFEKQLTRGGYTLATFEREKYLETLANTVIDRELKSTLKPEDAELKRRFEETPDRWTVPETVRVAQLLISTRNPSSGEELPDEAKKQRLQLIQELRARVEKGEDFSTLIRQHSDDTSSKTRKGEYVVVRGQMLIEFEAAAFSLKPGQLSDVVTTQMGFHLIKLIERSPERRRPFSEVEPVLRAQWIAEELTRQMPEYLGRLRREAGIELTPLAPKPAGSEP